MGERGARGATEIVPAGAVCWEQVVYLGQHIASSAFLSTRLSKTEKGRTCKMSCIIKSFCLCARRLFVFHTVNALARTVQHSELATQTWAHVKGHQLALINRNTRCVSVEGVTTSVCTSVCLLIPQVFDPATTWTTALKDGLLLVCLELKLEVAQLKITLQLFYNSFRQSLTKIRRYQLLSWKKNFNRKLNFFLNFL